MSPKLLAATTGVLAALLTAAAPAPAALAAPAASTASAAGKTSAQDEAFLRTAHQANLAEIAGGGVAVDRGASAQVRALGARFVRDHKAIDTALTATARKLGVELPDTPSAAQLALTKRYLAAEGKSFDTLYLTTQLTAHRQAMQAGKKELAHGRNTSVKHLVTKAAPIVKAHHDAIKKAEAQLGVS
jgi:putative membrane protein